MPSVSEFTDGAMLTVSVASAADVVAPVKDLRGGPTTLRRVHVDNANAGTPTSVYVKVYDSVSPNHAADEPVEMWRVAAGEQNSFSTHPPDGLALDNGLSIAVSRSQTKTASGNGVNTVVDLTLETT